MKVLLIEADEGLVVDLVKRLTSHHVVVDVVGNGDEGWSYGATFSYDLIVIDEHPPLIDGLDLCRKFREEGLTLPILLLLSAHSSTGLVEALDAGADDSMTSPPDLEELHARIRSLLRRGRANPFPVLVWGDLMLNSSTCEVTYRNQPILLTAKEYGLLELFLRDTQHVFSIEEILESLWSSEEFPSEATVRSHLRRLRRKLSTAGAPSDFIATVHGRGYYIKAMDSAVNGSHSSDFASSRTVASASTPEASSHSRTATLCPDLSQPQSTSTQPLYPASNVGSEVATVSSEAMEAPFSHQTISAHEPFSPHLPDLSSPPQAPVLLIVSPDKAAADAFAQAGLARGLWVAIAPSLDEAKLWLVPNAVRPHPDALLILMGSKSTSYPGHPPNSLERMLDTLRLIGSHELNVPTGVIHPAATWTDRLTAARHGCSLLLSDAVAPEAAIAALVPLIQVRVHRPKLLAIDSDPTWLQAMLTLLTPWGFEVITLDDAEPLLAILENIQPDAVVLDVHLCDYSGIELCRVLRMDPRWRHLPILFLSEETNATVQAQALAAGADDYMLKPMQGKELAERIMTRLLRLRLSLTE